MNTAMSSMREAEYKNRLQIYMCILELLLLLICFCYCYILVHVWQCLQVKFRQLGFDYKVSPMVKLSSVMPQSLPWVGTQVSGKYQDDHQHVLRTHLSLVGVILSN